MSKGIELSTKTKETQGGYYYRNQIVVILYFELIIWMGHMEGQRGVKCLFLDLEVTRAFALAH